MDLPGVDKLRHFPAALVGLAVTLAAACAARRLLVRGATNYWPDTQSRRLAGLADKNPGASTEVPV
jgi:hypothetical protein